MNKIRELRIDQGLSQAKLAARAEVDPSTVNQIERGARDASPLTLRKIAQALDVSLAELLQETDSPKAHRRSSPEPSLFNGAEDERLLRYLRAWRAFVWRVEQRWQHEPPTSSRDTSQILDIMNALREEGSFDLDATQGEEWAQLKGLLDGLKALNDIADGVEKAEEAEERRATFTLIQEKISA